MSRRRTRPASQRADSSTRAENTAPGTARSQGGTTRSQAGPEKQGRGKHGLGIALQVIYAVLVCFLVVLIFRLVMDYVFQFARSWQPGKAMVVVLEATYSVNDPPLKR